MLRERFRPGPGFDNFQGITGRDPVTWEAFARKHADTLSCRIPAALGINHLLSSRFQAGPQISPAKNAPNGLGDHLLFVGANNPDLDPADF